jgi:hypothetical protein
MGDFKLSPDDCTAANVNIPNTFQTEATYIISINSDGIRVQEGDE